MSSSNYLNIKSHLTELKSNSDRDTMSEASETGTSNSTNSEDLQKVALILGLSSGEEVFQERFRVDRRRLECMLADNLEEPQTAAAFFNNVMHDTGTVINWPARLKIGARSKKDPHVRVAGRSAEDVKLARERIMQILDTRSNRVTMKVDVSYTDHSHIIGKGGLTIKRVMEETGCHIHFPDSNRSNSLEKSNQVSIAGDMERVEKARARVRALTPLIFSFELPIMSASKPVPDLGSPFIQQVQETYNVQVMLRTRPKLHATMLVVKGVQWEVKATMEATKLLMDHMCGSTANQTQIHMCLDISPMHHQLVLGPQAAQLKVIMKNTGAQIMFPDADDPNIPALKKSNVTITGSIEEVYRARQQLVGSLPLVLIFDVPDERSIEQELVTRTMQKHSVFVNVRRKPRQGLVSVVIKGIERRAGDIYEARRELLGCTEPSIKAEVPESYHIPANANPMGGLNGFNPFSPTAANLPQSPLNCSPMPPMYIPEYSGYSSMFNPGFPSPLSPVSQFPQTWVIPPSPPNQPSPFQYPSVQAVNPIFGKQANVWNNGGGVMSRVHQQMLLQQYQHHVQQTASQPSSLGSMMNMSGPGSSGYQSNLDTQSMASIDTHSTSGGDCSSHAVSPSVSPINQSHSPNSTIQNEHAQDLEALLNELCVADRRAVGIEKNIIQSHQQRVNTPPDYTTLKSIATKAMQEEVCGYRTPNSRWSGYYFSHTSPASIKLDNIKQQSPENKSWNKSDVAAGAGGGSPGGGEGRALHECPRLAQLFTQAGLHKYIEPFRRHEVDIHTFASLNDQDLNLLGVSAFGARRKMLLLIKDMEKQRQSGGDLNSVLSPQNFTKAETQVNKW